MQRYVLIGLGGVVCVVSALHVVLGPHADVLLGSAISSTSLGDPTLDSQNRFYGAAFLLYGVLFVYCSSDIARYRDVLCLAIGVLFLAGLARVVSIVSLGWPAPAVVGLLAVELVLPPVLITWLRTGKED